MRMNLVNILKSLSVCMVIGLWMATESKASEAMLEISSVKITSVTQCGFPGPIGSPRPPCFTSLVLSFSGKGTSCKTFSADIQTLGSGQGTRITVLSEDVQGGVQSNIPSGPQTCSINLQKSGQNLGGPYFISNPLSVDQKMYD